MEIVGWFFFVLFLLIGLAVIPFGIAGTFIIVADVFLYALLTDFELITWKFLGVLLGISIIVEGLEFFLGAAAAKKYGSSSWGMWGAILGGFFGAIWGTAISPIFGTIFGAFIGAFLGAYLFEFVRFKDSQKALEAGWGAFLGTVTGRFLKFFAAILMLVLIGYKLL
jgi:uncharacterized protein YqgC (DUF456 family)